MVTRIQEGGTGQTTAPGARIALGLSDAEIIAIAGGGGTFYQPLDSDLTAIAALTTLSYGRGFLVRGDAAAARTYLGLGTMATATATDYLLVTTAASTYQPLSSHLTTLAGIDKTNNNFIVTNGTTFTYVNGSAARASLGLGTMATETASNYNTAAVDATTYAPLASPTFTGIVTTAGQIKFPATANPSSDVNTLDDYEEGTWTPVIGSTGGSITTYTSSGRYTKIGNRVITDLTFQITNLGTASGYLTATLPFTAVGASAATGREYTVNGASVHGTTINGSASITLVTYNNSTTIFSNNQTITISLSYVV